MREQKAVARELTAVPALDKLTTDELRQLAERMEAGDRAMHGLRHHFFSRFPHQPDVPARSNRKPSLDEYDRRGSRDVHWCASDFA